MSELIGRKVEFKILELRKNKGRSRECRENQIGTIKKVINTAVIIEGKQGGLYNRPIDKITILEPGR
jgi:hypothetical protein